MIYLIENNNTISNTDLPLNGTEKVKIIILSLLVLIPKEVKYGT